MDKIENWHEKDQAITVSEGNGFLYNLALRAKVDSSPNDIYSILTDPNTVSIFRSIKECTYRRVVEDDGQGQRRLEIGHRAVARFLFISISFETHLHVWENDVEKTIKFQLAGPGLMQKFDGCWRIKPFTQETLDDIYHPERLQSSSPRNHHHNHNHHHHNRNHQQHNGFGLFNAASLLGFLHHHRPPEARESLVTLEQSILPRGPTPPGLKGLVRGLCAHQLRCMMEDLRRELDRRKQQQQQQQEGSALTAAATAGTGDSTAPAAAAVSGSSKGQHLGSLAAAPAAACMALAGGGSLWAAVAPLCTISVRL
ncbi:hypothetical protein Agub_g274 [Astrephomene gubernaculifera]|uniref:Coenzyme Q-binding protein COQ10 START domain-containing protein n=1 Tax=Astrephomene gubernaculifera TaxID=47775 RepID=A0AAD3DEG1_9CHLO|nr:hypothetical protein Agub_g274 [Astrephomene gubernaculifera]